MFATEFCKKIAEEPSSNTDTSVEKSNDTELADEDENVFSASTLKAVTTASIIMNIRVSQMSFGVVVITMIVTG